MSEPTYWTKSRMNRRTVLRASGLGLLGVGGAALIGCGDSEDEATTATTGSTSGSTSGSTAGSTGGSSSESMTSDWYQGPRNPGFDSALGESPVNEKERVPGGLYTRVHPRDTTREQDPDVSIAGSDHEMHNDRLVIANGWTMEVSPDMLESWEVADDGLSIVMTMRPGIKTWDKAPVNGRIFTAEDVAYSLERKAGILDPEEAKKYARAGQYVGMTGAEAVDDVTVKVTLSQPNSALIAALSDPRAQVFPREMDEIGHGDPLKHVGTGAWIETEYVDGTRQKWVANPDYYRSPAEGGRPSFESLERLVITDRGSFIAAFLTGQIDQLDAIQTHEIPQVESSVSDALWYKRANLGWNHFAVNTKHPDLPWFQDKRVVQAIRLALPYDQLGDAFGEGWMYSGPLHVMFAESYKSDEIGALLGYNPDTKEQAIAEAQKMMAAAGYPEGEGISFKDTPSRAAGTAFDNAVRTKETFAQVFPKMVDDIVPVTDYASFTNLLNQRTFEARTYHHTMVPNAVADARTYYHTDGGRNYQGFSEPWADDILDKVLEVSDFDERQALFHQFEDRYLAEGGPLIQTVVSRDLYAYHPTVAGVDLVSGTWSYSTYQVGPRWYWRTV